MRGYTVSKDLTPRVIAADGCTWTLKKHRVCRVSRTCGRHAQSARTNPTPKNTLTPQHQASQSSPRLQGRLASLGSVSTTAREANMTGRLQTRAQEKLPPRSHTQQAPRGARGAPAMITHKRGPRATAARKERRQEARGRAPTHQKRPGPSRTGRTPVSTGNPRSRGTAPHSDPRPKPPSATPRHGTKTQRRRGPRTRRRRNF